MGDRLPEHRATSTDGVERATGKRSWVLIVDDNEANRYAISRMLRGAGFDVSDASTGAQALRLARSLPDLIVLDVNLPDLTGFEVVRRLREDHDTAFIPVLHLSASYLRDADRAAGLDGGANGYLTHPVDRTVFLATVRSLLRVRRAEEHLAAAAAEWQATFDAISDTVLVLDGDGSVLRANRATEQLLQMSPAELLGKDALALMRQALGRVDITELRDAMRTRTALVRELAAGERWYRVALDPIRQRASSRGSVVCVISDITERKVAEWERAILLASTETARGEAEAANRAKSEFLATMSHEIRTPINAVLGYAQILDMGIPGSLSTEQRAHLDRLRKSATHLLGLVNEILDLAKVESGQLRVEQERATVDDAIESALALSRPMALQRGITIVDACERAQSLAYVGDAGRVRQILVNVLSNAVKFTEPGGRISVDCGLSDGAAHAPLAGAGPWVTITVSDTGIGIDPKQLHVIFEPFVQAESGWTRTRGGTGLGLTISRRLARLMGGDLTAESTPGVGSRFTLWLALATEGTMARTAEMPAESRRRAAAYDSSTLSRVGYLLLGMIPELTNRLLVRLRTDSSLPPLGTLTDAQITDHLPTFLSELAQSLMIIAEPEGDASTLLRDGNAIRVDIAERHGMQRHALGWTAAHLEREYVMIADEIERAARARQPSDETLESAIRLLARIIEQSMLASVRGLRQARAEQT